MLFNFTVARIQMDVLMCMTRSYPLIGNAKLWQNRSMITPPLKTERAAARAEADPFALAVCAIADLAAYAQRQRLTMADELLLELLAFLFEAQAASSGVKLVAGRDSATPDMQGLLQFAPGGDAAFGVDHGRWPGGSRY